MMVLVLFIHVKVQAKDLAFTTFHPSSLPIMLPHPFKLDNVQRPFTICIEEKAEKCKEMIETKPKESAICVIKSFKQCAEETPLHDIMAFKALEATAKCLFEKNKLAMRDCYLQRYEININ